MQPFLMHSHGYHDSAEYGYISPPRVKAEAYSAEELRNRQANAGLLQLVSAYRRYGHLSSNLDPLGIQKSELLEELSAGMYGLGEDSDVFDIKGKYCYCVVANASAPPTCIVAPSNDLPASASLSAIVAALQKTYCRNISYEFEHIEIFEHFMQKKLPNVKRYGLEGSEAIAVLLDQIIYEGARQGIADVVAGLSHRGRMSLLAALFGYPKDELLRKLRGGSEFPDGSPWTGDMLVDLAKPGTVRYDDLNATVNIDVLWNACHLESGTPVGMGKSRIKDINMARAKKNKNHTIGDHVLAVSVHGDSSFAGQGVVAESLGMSGLAHFTNGGTVHVVNNNQIGYTTPASHTRMTRYASDIAKFADIPIIHVNGEHPEELARAAHLAVAYRQKFRKDIVIDVWTFRKRGHNEMDEPTFTQPAMYDAINKRASIPAKFEAKLISSGHLTKDAANAVKLEWLTSLNEAFAASETCAAKEPTRALRWRMLGSSASYPVEKTTGVSTDTLYEVGIKSVAHSDSVKVHPRIERFHIKPRLKRLHEGHAVDWATAEALAFGTLLKEGYNVRLSGQDVGRGTFSQRHVMFVCQDSENVYVPLNHMDADQPSGQQGKLEVVNSNLCEEAVVGFEYGVAVEDPFTLTIWEAQFGDFYNNSQTIVDGYIASGETKWGQQNGLVLLLPHGFDGGGPDHSSCRIERHLMLSNDPVDDHPVALPNIYVAYPSTPAQFFHLMRRQVKRNFRKPLIVAGPKTMLRLASATSLLSEMGPGTRFKPVLDDPSISDPRAVKRVMLVSGKLYYDLAKLKSEHPLGQHAAIVRIEELSPFPREELYNVLSQYTNASDFVWVQEEPRNSGAYAFSAPRVKRLLPAHAELRYVGRSEHAATCSGVETQQAAEHAELTRCAFEGLRGLVADLVIDNISIQHDQHQSLDEPVASVISAEVSHRWSNRQIYAAQSSDQ
ncbi:hypothetical protein IWW37_002228 [Coemansia sp. RSA 2050]|nr:hypothetical protein IWW37_002228 [Coemansia sp. RSA 2050]